MIPRDDVGECEEYDEPNPKGKGSKGPKGKGSDPFKCKPNPKSKGKGKGSKGSDALFGMNLNPEDMNRSTFLELTMAVSVICSLMVILVFVGCYYCVCMKRNLKKGKVKFEKVRVDSDEEDEELVS